MAADASNMATNPLNNPFNSLCPVTGYGDGQEYTLWSCFGSAAILNLLLCMFVYSLAPMILAMVFGGFYYDVKEKSPESALSLRIEVVIHEATITGMMSAFEALLMHRMVEFADDGREKAFDIPARPAVWMAVGAILGYMLWHMCVMSGEKEHGQEPERVMYTLMWVHVYVLCSFGPWPLQAQGMLLHCHVLCKD